MAAYTKINFADVDNSSKTDGLEMRFSRKHLNSKELGVTLSKYSANYKAAKSHSHKVQEEAYVVVRGSGKMLLDDSVEELKAWDVVLVPPEVSRAFEAGPDGLDIIAIGGSKPIEGDGVSGDANWPS
ncbi:MAG TPA: hypothetical protein VL989_00525 [Candidatus Sulfotelmatobacter sp.]|nr:hypothetical protein [Candidatus Sulfotelmatobacter sp.]